MLNLSKKTVILAAAVLGLMMPAMAQTNKWGCTDEQKKELLETVSLYQNNMKQFKSLKDERYLQEAYPYWQKIVATCPKQSKNLYLNGTTMLKTLYNKAENAEERERLLNELLAMYDTRIANYGEAAEVTARKAMDVEQLRGEAGLEQYYELYAKAIEIGGDELDAAYVVKYMEATIKYVKAGKAEPTLVVDNYDIASELLEKELQANAADTTKANTIRRYINGVEAAFSPYADCEQLITIYQKKFEADPSNVALLKKITGIMMKKGCTESQLFFDATEKLYAIEPSPSTAMRMGQMSYSKKDYKKAEDYLEDAVKSITDQKDLYKAYIILGLCQSARNAYSAARSSFLQAAKIDQTKGEPYLQIANLYAQSSRSIDDGMNGRSAYWAAADKARKAKEVDPTDAVIEAANKMIGTFSAYYPKKADAFMLNLMDGNGYRVGGWIGESTTVRTR